MNAQIILLAKITLSWDLLGRIKHEIKSDFNFNNYQIEDALGYSSVVSFESQLGILPIKRSLMLCTKVLDFIESDELIYEPVNSCLRGVEIEIVKGESVFHQFKPNVRIFSNNDNIEDSISQFIRNYLLYTYKNVSSEGLPLRIKVNSLYAIKFYLCDILYPLVGRGIIKNANTNYWEIQKKIIEDTHTFYDSWNKYQTFHEQKDKIEIMFYKTIPFCRIKLREIADELRIN